MSCTELTPEYLKTKTKNNHEVIWDNHFLTH